MNIPNNNFQTLRTVRDDSHGQKESRIKIFLSFLFQNQYNKWRGWADEKVCCDYALKVTLPSVSEESLSEMRELTGEEFGINTFCMSMEGDNKLSDEDLMRGFEGIKEVGGLAQVHAESGEIVEKLSQRMLDNGVTGPEGYAMAHSVSLFDRD